MKPWIARGRSGERAEDGPAAGKAPRYTHSASRGASWDPYARKPSIRRTLPTPAEQKEVLKAYGLSHVVWADEARGSDLLRGKTVARISVDTEGNQEEDWNAAVDPTLVQIALELVNPSQDRSLSTAAEIVVVLFAPLVHDSSTLDWLRKATKQLYVYVWCTNDSKELSYVASLLKTSKTVGQQVPHGQRCDKCRRAPRPLLIQRSRNARLCAWRATQPARHSQAACHSFGDMPCWGLDCLRYGVLEGLVFGHSASQHGRSIDRRTRVFAFAAMAERCAAATWARHSLLRGR
jgi:hypothetical protein